MESVKPIDDKITPSAFERGIRCCWYRRLKVKYDVAGIDVLKWNTMLRVSTFESEIGCCGYRRSKWNRMLPLSTFESEIRCCRDRRSKMKYDVAGIDVWKWNTMLCVSAFEREIGCCGYRRSKWNRMLRVSTFESEIQGCGYRRSNVKYDLGCSGTVAAELANYKKVDLHTKLQYDFCRTFNISAKNVS